MSAWLNQLLPEAAPRIGRQPHIPSLHPDVGALLARMRGRFYPETLPVLISYWLKAVSKNGHQLRWWKNLHGEFTQLLAEQPPADAPSRQALIELHTWIQNEVLLPAKVPPSAAPAVVSGLTSLDPERLKPYLVRLLNEWLPLEVARLLISESESMMWDEGGIPVLAAATSLERLLIRERLSPQTLEMFLRPDLLSPRYVYPADAEILRDVVSALLGRTWAPAPPVMPATLLSVAAGAPLPADYREAVRAASLVAGPYGDEIHVPLAPAACRQILQQDYVQIGSILVSMDGRWWESGNLHYGEDDAVVYRPMGRLRIDFSADHATVRVPWPEPRFRWGGEVHFRQAIELFGREWRVSRWEEDGKRTWLDLVFVRALAIPSPAADGALRRSRPASVDMAWAALENALAASILQNSSDPIEQLRHSDLIPLGRTMFELAASVKGVSRKARERIQGRLEAMRYLESPILDAYGRVPWRILPPRVSAALLLRSRSDGAISDLMIQVFEGFPETRRAAVKQSPRHAA
jgi:hypothetical protein